MKKVKLTNNFHNTECYVMVRFFNIISKRQVKRAWKKLCGIKGCTCGDIAGCRPHVVDDTESGNGNLNDYLMKQWHDWQLTE